MSNNVVTLPKKKTPIEYKIETLEKLRKMIEEGKVEGFIGIALGPDVTAEINIGTYAANDAVLGLELLKAEIIDEIRSDVTEEKEKDS